MSCEFALNLADSSVWRMLNNGPGASVRGTGERPPKRPRVLTVQDVSSNVPVLVERELSHTAAGEYDPEHETQLGLSPD